MDERQYERAEELACQEREAGIERARAAESLPPREREGVRYCLGCDDPIDSKRLVARPSAVRCLYCQQDHERRGAMMGG